MFSTSFTNPILFRQTLKLVDKNGDLVVLVVPHGHQALKTKLATLQQEIDALFPGELERIDSMQEGYNFLALHYTYYNRYFESVGSPISPLIFPNLTIEFRGKVLLKVVTPTTSGRKAS